MGSSSCVYSLFQEVCYQYWPEKRTQRYGEFSVELLNEERKRGFLLRTFSVQEAKVYVENESQMVIGKWYIRDAFFLWS